MELKEIVDKPTKKLYYAHRVALSPLFINFNIKNNGMAPLLTFEEFCSLGDEIDDIFVLPHSFWTDDSTGKSENEKLDELDFTSYLESNGITKEMYFRKLSDSREEQLQKFFKKGLYVVESSISRTASNLGDDPLEKLKGMLNKPNFSFNAGNNFLGTLASREEELNVLLILEIPIECIKGQKRLLPLFESKEETITLPTTYRGVVEMDMAIPRQYIKGAFSRNGNTLVYYKNEEYSPEYLASDGKYDDEALEKLIQAIIKDGYDFERASAAFDMIARDYDLTEDVSKFKDRINGIAHLMQREATATDENIELHSRIVDKINQVRRKTLSPLQLEYEELNLANLSDEEIEEKARMILKLGQTCLSKQKVENKGLEFFQELRLYGLLLQSFDEGMLSRLGDSRLIEEIRVRKEQIETLEELSSISTEIAGDIAFGGAEDPVLLRRQEENSSQIEAFQEQICSDYVAKRI